MKRQMTFTAAFVFALSTMAIAGDKVKCDTDLASCLKAHVNKLKDHGWVGIEMDENKETKATFVKAVVPGSPAEKAGFQAGDVLVSVNGYAFASHDYEAKKVATKDWKPGSVAKYVVSRNGANVDVAVTLGKPTEDIMAEWVGYYALELVKAEEQVAQK